MRPALCRAICSIAVLTALAVTTAAQTTNPRFGKWRLKPNDPAQTSNNVMTYEPFNGTGMRTAEITYRRDGRITQQLTNVLSADGNVIGIIYMRPGADGKPDTVTFATYERMK